MSVVHDIIDKAMNAGRLTFDIETTSEDIHSAGFDVVGCAFCVNSETWYLTDLMDIADVVREMFSTDADIIGFNVKFDLQGLARADLLDDYPQNPVDVMVAVNLCNENRSPGRMGLKACASDILGVQMVTYEEVVQYGVESQQFAEYAKDDVRQTERLWDWCAPRMKKDEVMKVFRKIYMPMLEYVSDMEYYGILWSTDKARDMILGFIDVRDQAEQEIRAELGNEINLRSGDRLAKKLFEEKGYSSRGVPLTKSGKRLSVNAEVMDKLAVKYPVCARIRDHRNAEKMLGTYLLPITETVMETTDGRIHPSFWLTSSTGRMRCSNPNMQNVPVIPADKYPGYDLDIRKCIVAPPGRKLIVADLSQIELRLCAHITKDKALLSAYRTWQCTKCESTGESDVFLVACPNCGEPADERTIKVDGFKGFWHGLDIHQQTADATGLPRNPSSGTKAAAKNFNFAVIYNVLARTCTKQFGTYSAAEWQTFIDRYFEHYPGVKTWHVVMGEVLQRTGKVRDIFGRLRRIPKRDRGSKHALNQIINYPVQCSATHYMMLCAIKCRERFIREGVWFDGVWPNNVVHDELVLEVTDTESTIQFGVEVVEDVMRNAVRLQVPVNCEVKVVDSWGDAK